MSKQKPHHKQAWRWALDGANAARVMELLHIYMFERRGNRIDEILRGWYELVSEKEETNKDRTGRLDCAVAAYADPLITLKMAADLYGFNYVTVHKEWRKISERA